MFLAQIVAQTLQTCCQVDEKNVVVYKLLDGLLHHNRMQSFAVPPFLSGISDNTADEVCINVHELDQHGKDEFIAKLRLQRLDLESSICRNML